MTRIRVGAAGMLAAVLLFALPTTASAAERRPTTNSYEHAIAGFGGSLGAGLTIDALFDVFNFTLDGEPATTLSVHAEVNGERFGLVCDADGPATLWVAEDLSSATLSGTVEGTCINVDTFEVHSFTVTFEIIWIGSGRLERETRVIRTDDGAICRQHFLTRQAGASGTATVVVPGTGIDAQIEVGPAPFHQLERVEELCVPGKDG